MKTWYTLLLATCVLNTHAQLHNGGFEELNGIGLPVNWQGNVPLLNVTFDSSGVAHVDSVIYDGDGLYTLNSTDVHSGLHAIELRNAFNHTANEPIIGVWSASNDSGSYTGFPLFNMDVLQRPTALEFYAEFLPLGGDRAWARIEVFDAGLSQIGVGEVIIDGAYPTYTPFVVPITYTAADSALFMSVSFATAEPGGTATFGTRFLIDDVGLRNSSVSVAELDAAGSRIRLYPNPAQDHFTVELQGQGTVLAVRLIDVAGAQHAAPFLGAGQYRCSGLADGSYVVEVRTAQGRDRRMLTIRH